MSLCNSASNTNAFKVGINMQNSSQEKLIEFDKEGFLKNLSDWDKDIAIKIAAKEAIELTENHWEIIELLRNFYDQFQISPSMRALVKHTEKQLGTEKGRSVYLLQLFPKSPVKLASKISGLPKPPNCI